MTKLIIEALKQWCKDAFVGQLVPRDEVCSLNGGRAFTLTDDQCPFGRIARIAKVETDGGMIIVQSWCTRYSCGRVAPNSARVATDTLTVPLSDPNSLPKVMEELFQISFDYCRWLYRQAIKGRRKHLKPLITEMADLFRQERKKCQAIDYQLDSSELSITC